MLMNAPRTCGATFAPRAVADAASQPLPGVRQLLSGRGRHPEEGGMTRVRPRRRTYAAPAPPSEPAGSSAAAGGGFERPLGSPVRRLRRHPRLRRRSSRRTTSTDFSRSTAPPTSSSTCQASCECSRPRQRRAQGSVQTVQDGGMRVDGACRSSCRCGPAGWDCHDRSWRQAVSGTEGRERQDRRRPSPLSKLVRPEPRGELAYREHEVSA